MSELYIMSVSGKVNKRVGHMKRGIPFPISGFYTLGSRTSVQKAMSRLAKEGSIERVSKGFYARPKPLPSLPSIKVISSAEQLAHVWAKEYNYKLVEQGLEEAYRLGFQTQAPIKTVYWSNGPTRLFKIGKEVIEVRHITEQKLRWIGRPEGVFLRGLTVMSPESIEIHDLQKAFKRMQLSKQEAKRIVHKLKSALLTVAWQEKFEQLERVMIGAYS